jgi:Domain of unknown function (DUF1929)
MMVKRSILLLVFLAACTESAPGTDLGRRVASISVFADRGTLAPGETGSLRVIAKDASGTILEPTPKLTWTSSNPGVLEIGSDRTVLAKVSGSATLTAGANGQTSNSVTLEVGAIDAPATVGRWSSLIPWPITAVHASLMPDGTLVTFPWRKTSPWGKDISTFSGYAAGGMTGQPKTQVDTWNPTTDAHTTTWETKADLFVAGGSATGPDWTGIRDDHVLANGVWSPVSSMSVPRWYPSVTTLGSGEVLVAGGYTDQLGVNSDLSEIWNPKTDTWRSLIGARQDIPLYPRLHVAPDGTVLLSGPDTNIRRLNTTGTGSWTSLGKRDTINRVYGSSVLFDEGRVLEVGGSNPADPTLELRAATNTAKVIDLRTGSVATTGSMRFGRRNLNATVLPDQTVLINGGNAVGNGKDSDFSLDISQRYQKESELWNPNTGTFRTLASERVGRPYHSVALLLPDARVFSAGGYDEVPFPNTDPTYRPRYNNAQMFSPPYLFARDGTLAPRPEILEAPDRLAYDQGFSVRVNNPDGITKACLIRFGSVTHAFNFGQRFVGLELQHGTGSLELRSPKNANLAPPGFYYLFVIDANGVPSVAKTVRVTDQP